MTSEKKTRVAVLFGGVSSEHEISLMSVESVLANLPDHYEVLRIGITKDGRWVEYTGRNDEITSQKWEQDPTLRTAIVSPDRSHKGACDRLGDICIIVFLLCVRIFYQKTQNCAGRK